MNLNNLIKGFGLAKHLTNDLVFLVLFNSLNEKYRASYKKRAFDK